MSETTPQVPQTNDQPQQVVVVQPKRGHPTAAWIIGTFGLVIGLGPALFYIGALAFGLVGLLLGIGAYRAARKLHERAGLAGIVTGFVAITLGIVGAVTVESAIDDLDRELDVFEQEMNDLDAELETQDAELEADLEAYDEALEEWEAKYDAIWNEWQDETDALLAQDFVDYEQIAALDERFEQRIAELEAEYPEP